MRELLLKLLTYEPFEKIAGDEKKYIDDIILGNINITTQTVANNFMLFHDLFKDFYAYVQSGQLADIVWIQRRFQNYYLIKQAGKISALYYKNTNERAYYPVLFKKICFYCQTGRTCLISQPCPAIVNYIEHYQPELISQLMPIQSPMICEAIYLKKYQHVAEELIKEV